MKLTRLRLTAALLSVFLLVSGCAAAEKTSPTAEPQAQATVQPTAAPGAAQAAATPEPWSENAKGMPFLMFDQEGAPMTFSDLKGKVTYLNFFTTWCYYCTQEMPELFKLYQTYGDELQVVLIHVPSDDTYEAAVKYLKDNGFDGMRMVEDKDMFLTQMFQLEGFPLSVIIDKEGYLSTYQPGAMTYEQMEEAVKAAGLEVPKAE